MYLRDISTSEALALVQWQTHGGLKNCSNTTHIPLAISVRRKYLPALSNVDSLLWSHLSGLGSRKPAGGGPDGVAARKVVVENAARVFALIGDNRCAELQSVPIGRFRATSIVRGFADGIL